MHLGLIIDGNRRYAKSTGVPLETAYDLGAERVCNVIKSVFGKTKVKEVSVYALSYDNIMRNKDELAPVIDIQKRVFDEWTSDPFFDENGIRVRFIGDVSILPADFRESCLRLQEKTAKNSDRTLNMLVAYMGSREIKSTVRRMIEHVKAGGGDDIDDLETFIDKSLYLTAPVDLIIRTAGENRLSGFLPLETEYSEFYSINKFWPEITAEEIDIIIQDFGEKVRKHGL